MRGDGSSIQRSVFVISLLNQFHHLYGFIWIRENLQQITPWRRTASMFPHDDRSRSDTLQQGDEKATFQWVKSSTRMQKRGISTCSRSRYPAYQFTESI
uniref:Uncharacterized protein n=1 Tax=Oryza glumipatula TaxID=40148 RepID=A0A0D9ZC84_9ORYZ